MRAYKYFGIIVLCWLSFCYFGYQFISRLVNAESFSFPLLCGFLISLIAFWLAYESETK
jgi:hypothetical protein